MITIDTKFCLVIDGTINKYNVTQSKTGLGVNSTLRTYIDKGWYPLEDNAPTIDSATQRITGSSYEVQVDKVVKSYTVITIPDEEQLSIAKDTKIQEIKSTTISNAPVTINHATYGDITYNGGDVSASAINGAITLAQMNGSSVIKLWDYYDKLRDYTELEAFEIGKEIANDYKDVMEIRQNRITAVNEIEIGGTYPTIADAKIAIDLI